MKCNICGNEVEEEDIEDDGHWIYKDGCKSFCR